MKVIKHLLLTATLSGGLVSCASVADANATAATTLSNTASSSANASEQAIYRVRLFFGLSKPKGGGVSLKQWLAFRDDVIAKTFDGFNVVDSTGFYEGKPERSKVVTIIVNESDMPKVKAVASNYAKTFEQDSVMMVKVKVDEWAFIGPNG